MGIKSEKKLLTGSKRGQKGGKRGQSMVEGNKGEKGVEDGKGR